MRKFGNSIIWLLFFMYKYTLSPMFSALGTRCRFEPSCSAYAEESIYRYGVVKGIYLAVTRVLRCQPFCAPGYDPVPLKKDKVKR